MLLKSTMECHSGRLEIFQKRRFTTQSINSISSNRFAYRSTKIIERCSETITQRICPSLWLKKITIRLQIIITLLISAKIKQRFV